MKRPLHFPWDDNWQCWQLTVMTTDSSVTGMSTDSAVIGMTTNSDDN